MNPTPQVHLWGCCWNPENRQYSWRLRQFFSYSIWNST